MAPRVAPQAETCDKLANSPQEFARDSSKFLLNLALRMADEAEAE